MLTEIKTGYNRRLAKKRVQCLNEALYFVSSKNKEKMFTVEQIKTAHSKVKSGADFPAYIQDLKKLGVTQYETFVADGHTDYYGANDFKTTSPAKYELLTVAEK